MPSSDSMAGAAPLHGLSAPVAFSTVIWTEIPQLPGVYVIYEGEEAIYVGMSGRNGKGNLRSRLRDHRSGQMVNMFAQYLFLDRVQFTIDRRIRHPREAKEACHRYIMERCSFRFRTCASGEEALALEAGLKGKIGPSLNP